MDTTPAGSHPTLADPLLTIGEVAANLKCSEETVRRMIRLGRFRPVRLIEGRRRGMLRIPLSQVEAIGVVAPSPLPPPPPLTVRQRGRVQRGSRFVAY